MSKKLDGRKAEIDGRVWIAQDVWANPTPFRRLHTASTICPRQKASDVFHGKAGIFPKKAPAKMCNVHQLDTSRRLCALYLPDCYNTHFLLFLLEIIMGT